jgi:hypothetical protein
MVVKFLVDYKEMIINISDLIMSTSLLLQYHVISIQHSCNFRITIKINYFDT